jgi:hypothetical protein
MKSDKFQKLLATDESTIEGQDFIAEYYGISNWAQLKEKGGKDGVIQNQADSYFYLLKSVKAKSNKDNVWISFYEGHHRHAALLITLLSAIFNPTKNVFKQKSLTAIYFREQQLNHYKEDTKTPTGHLPQENQSTYANQTFWDQMYCTKTTCDYPTINDVFEFTQKVSKYSELISDTTKTSADNSTSSLLSKALMNELSLCRRRDCVSDNHMLRVEHYYTLQVTMTRGKHEKNMKASNNDNQQIYNRSRLLKTPEWNAYVENPLDYVTRVKFLDRITRPQLLDTSPEAILNPYPPYR